MKFGALQFIAPLWHCSDANGLGGRYQVMNGGRLCISSFNFSLLRFQMHYV